MKNVKTNLKASTMQDALTAISSMPKIKAIPPGLSKIVRRIVNEVNSDNFFDKDVYEYLTQRIYASAQKIIEKDMETIRTNSVTTYLRVKASKIELNEKSVESLIYELIKIPYEIVKIINEYDKSISKVVNHGLKFQGGKIKKNKGELYGEIFQKYDELNLEKGTTRNFTNACHIVCRKWNKEKKRIDDNSDNEISAKDIHGALKKLKAKYKLSNYKEFLQNKSKFG